MFVSIIINENEKEKCFSLLKTNVSYFTSRKIGNPIAWKWQCASIHLIDNCVINMFGILSFDVKIYYSDNYEYLTGPTKKPGETMAEFFHRCIP